MPPRSAVRLEPHGSNPTNLVVLPAHGSSHAELRETLCAVENSRDYDPVLVDAVYRQPGKF